jgi:hypothetical protein
VGGGTSGSKCPRVLAVAVPSAVPSPPVRPGTQRNTTCPASRENTSPPPPPPPIRPGLLTALARMPVACCVCVSCVPCVGVVCALRAPVCARLAVGVRSYVHRSCVSLCRCRHTLSSAPRSPLPAPRSSNSPPHLLLSPNLPASPPLLARYRPCSTASCSTSGGSTSARRRPRRRPRPASRAPPSGA